MKANYGLQYNVVYPRCYILVKEECTHHNPIVQFSFILHVLYVNILIKFIYNLPFIIFVLIISFCLKPKVGVLA